MEIELSEHLLVDPKDIECVICYSRFSHITNEAMIISCGHTVCSRCLKNIKICPLCRTEIVKKPTKNMLLSSLLEKDSHYKKCLLHQKPLEIYCKKTEKLLCSQCLFDQYQEDYEPLKTIESKIKEICEQEKAIAKKKEENKDQLHKILTQKNLNVKRKIDELYDEKLVREFSNKKKLKKQADTLLVSEKDFYEHLMLAKGFPLYEESLQELQTMWRNERSGAVAAQILKAQVIPGQLVQIYEEKAKEIYGDIHNKEGEICKFFMEQASDYEQVSKYFDEQLSLTTMYIEIEDNPNVEISRNYFINTLKDYGFEAVYKEKIDNIILERSVDCSALQRFYPEFFHCSLEKVNLTCNKISDAKFQLLCEILKHVQKLTRLTFDLDKTSPQKIDLISGLFFKLDTVQKFYCRTPLTLSIQSSFKNLIESLLNSKRISSFTIRTHNSHALLHCHQEQTSRSAQIFKPLTRFSVKSIGTPPLILDPILKILSSHFVNLTSLENIRFCFGKGVKYDKLIDALCEILPKSNRLFELFLGFADATLLGSNSRASKISQTICSLTNLTKVTLFLSGDSLSEERIYNDFFVPSEPRPAPDHRLEDFSLTIMRCGFVDIEMITKYLCRFPQLKKLVVKINRTFISFTRILKFLASVTFLRKLNYLEIVCRDMEALNEAEKKELQVCKFRLVECGISCKVVFEELSSQHLPDFVDLLSDDEEDDADESETQEESDYSDESEDGEIGASDSTA